MSTHDLSGGWSGIFSYPHSMPATAFRAEIRDVAGTLSGTIDEIDQVGDGGPLHAALDGRRDGADVRFTKYYAGADEEYDVVGYEGAVGADGCEIHGRWSIPGVWSGSFIMVRDTTMAVAQREATEVVR